MDPSLRRSLYTVMLVATVGLMSARVANVELLYEPSVHTPRPILDKPGEFYPARKWPDKVPQAWPTFGSNDRARWATVKALVEEGTFVIGRRVEDPKDPKGYRDEGIRFTDGFGTVDMVLHPERQEFFGTKPPLLTVVAAGEYWLLHKLLKWNISEHRWEVVVTILLTLNVLPLALALLLFSRLLERFGTTDWGRLFTFASACFGTFLTTFAVTLNNHVPAACCIFFAAYALLPGGPTPIGIGRGALAGLFAGLAICMDLPAAAFAGVAGLVLLTQSPRALIGFIPAVLVPIAAQTALNYAAVGTWLPVYAQFGGPWYEFPGSHWEKLQWKERGLPQPAGIDFIDEPKHLYAFHLLFGHHGLFSLTPVWLLALGGFFGRGRERLVKLTPLILVVVIGFYIYKTNNYGGWTSGPRWLFWLTPLLLLGLIPVADWLGKWRVGRGVAYLCLGASAFSATYPWANPWRHPWIYQWCEYMDWVHY